MVREFSEKGKSILLEVITTSLSRMVSFCATLIALIKRKNSVWEVIFFNIILIIIVATNINKSV